MPDYVNQTITFLDENWNTSNYSPKPVLVDRRDSQPRNSSEWRSVSRDLSDGNVVSVGGAGNTYEPEGIGWSKKQVDATVSVRIEGAHTDRHGDVANASDFGSLVDEVERSLELNRTRPISGYDRLEVRSANTRSGEHGDYFREDLEAVYVGREDLP